MTPERKTVDPRLGIIACVGGRMEALRQQEDLRRQVQGFCDEAIDFLIRYGTAEPYASSSSVGIRNGSYRISLTRNLSTPRLTISEGGEKMYWVEQIVINDGANTISRPGVSCKSEVASDTGEKQVKEIFRVTEGVMKWHGTDATREGIESARKLLTDLSRLLRENTSGEKEAAAIWVHKS